MTSQTPTANKSPVVEFTENGSVALLFETGDRKNAGGWIESDTTAEITP